MKPIIIANKQPVMTMETITKYCANALSGDDEIKIR
jgi:hypothetical protein